MVKENVLMSISVHNEYRYTCMLYTLIQKHRDKYTHTENIHTHTCTHTQNPIHTPTCMLICTHTHNEAGKRPRNLNNENFDMIMHCESDVELGRRKAQF